MNRTPLVAALVCGLFAGVAGAQQEPAAAATPADPFTAADRNGDDNLDREELRNMMARFFTDHDKDGDGTLSPDEQAGIGGGGAPVTREAFLSATDAAFTKADRDGDGKLSRAENEAGGTP